MHIYGELAIERIEGFDIGNCSRDSSNNTKANNQCPKISLLASGYFSIYMIMANVLLLNLLIATFNYTYKTIKDNSEKWYSYQKLLIIKDFISIPLLPPPLNIPFIIIGLIKIYYRSRNKEIYSNFIDFIQFDKNYNLNWQDIARKKTKKKQ